MSFPTMIAPVRISPVVPFAGFNAFTPVVPEVYKNAYSMQQQIHDMCCMLHKLKEYADMLGANINLDHEAINRLEEQFNQFMESGFDDYYKEQIREWVSDNFLQLMKNLLNQGVWFGLTDDGYFCANSLWQLLIEFDTDADPQSETYGHLILRY